MLNTQEVKIPKFAAHVCPHDRVTIEDNFFTFTVRIEPDADTKLDYDCYSKKALKAWKQNDWFFCGLVITAEYNSVPLPDNDLASLWGIEANFPGTDNSYLSDIVRELLPEAQERAQEVLKELREALDA